VYPLALWQKERFFSSVPVMDAVTNWFWIAHPLLLGSFFFALSAGVRQKILCYVCITAASFFLAFAAAEVYLNLPGANATQEEYDSNNSVHVRSGQATDIYELGYSAPDPVLGYGPNEKMRIASRRVKGGAVIYDVLYSRDQAGRRITPDRGDKADTAILLFGCSFTFGEGLNNEETFAWQLGEILGKRFQVFNCGFGGYGPHQMLALVTSGRLDALMRRYEHVYAFYLIIPGHAVRCIGLSPWDQSGPRYILKNGALKHVGTFNETPEYNKLYQADKLFARSKVYAHIKEAHRTGRVPDYAMETLIAITAKSMQELAARYHAHALTIVWPKFASIEPLLRNSGIRTLPLTGAMPDYTSVPEKYAIPGDGHPNALANTRVAEALAEYILAHPQATGERR
jgi:lysophospholipase L1-like esterase